MADFLSIAGECCDIGDNERVFLRKETSVDGTSPVDVEALASKLTERVEGDGGTHISLELLLHRCPELQTFLGGRDLMQLKEENERCFDGIEIFVKGGKVYLQSKQSRCRGQMEVDETGLYSVASARWGTAFASLMAQHCRAILGNEPKNTIAIDLTAACGGMTLPLAKAFERVVAVEIDAHRAELCRRNMTRHSVIGRVDIRNEDSVELIPALAEGVGQYPRVVVIDPPWGGMYYKSEDRPIMMGQWSLVDVLKRVFDHLSPTVVGLRMPVLFDKDNFLEQLDDADVVVHAAEVKVKRMGPQLFLILSSHSN